MGEAFRIANDEMESDNLRIKTLRDKFWNQIKDVEEIYLNGDLENRIPGNLNISLQLC